MNDYEPLYKNSRIILFILVILGSIIAIMPSYSNEEIQSNLKFGLDLEGGSWLQLQLQGAIAHLDADEEKIIQLEFGRLLNDTIKVDEITQNSVTFTISKETTQKEIDSFGYGSSSISKSAEGGTRITLQTDKTFLIQKYLENSLNAEVKSIPGRLTAFEIRTAVTEDSLNDILKPIDGKVIPPFRVGVTRETRDSTTEVLNAKLNPISLKQITVTPIGDNYLLVDLPGVAVEEAEKIALTPGKFEIRIQVQGNETAHVLFGTDIKKVDPIQKESVRVAGATEKVEKWGVPFELSDGGAQALRDAAIQYGAVTNPEAHYLSMYLDQKLVFDAPLDRELAKNIKSVPVKTLVATTGQGEEGQKKARELQIHLSAGALPVKVIKAGSGEVPAPLGKKFREQLIIAGIISLFVVALIVFLRYKQPNIIIPMLATSFSEVIIILGVAAIANKWIQLDLATITGIIAVIGTGVDHLIIITDEVLAGGVMPPSKVYKMRLAKAFTIIVAAAATVLAAMSPLIWWMDSSALRGFAIITIIGVFIGVGIARPAYAVIIQGMLAETSDDKFVDED
jgi:preprotein translocase subunit SecD